MFQPTWNACISYSLTVTIAGASVSRQNNLIYRALMVSEAVNEIVSLDATADDAGLPEPK